MFRQEDHKAKVFHSKPGQVPLSGQVGKSRLQVTPWSTETPAVLAQPTLGELLLKKAPTKKKK